MTQPGMTADEASNAGQEMLQNAVAQKEQIANGFLSQRQAVLDDVARRQADIGAVPTQSPPDSSGMAQALPQFTQAEIDNALATLGAAQNAPAPQVAQTPPSDTFIMHEIVQAIRHLVATEVRAQLSAVGFQAPAKKVENP